MPRMIRCGTNMKLIHKRLHYTRCSVVSDL